MLELVFAPAEKWISRSDEDIIAATMRVRRLHILVLHANFYGTCFSSMLSVRLIAAGFIQEGDVQIRPQA